MAQEPLLYYEEIPGKRPDSPVLILLHGLGANEQDLLPLVDYIARGWHAISLRAPFQTEFGGYAWYSFIQGAGPEASSYKQGVKELAAFFEDAHKSNPKAKMVTLGFSQGALMALSAATLRIPGFVAVAALSGYLPPEDMLPAPLDRLRGYPVFQTHARNDLMLSFALAEKARDRLTKAGADLTWLEHDSGHSIPLSALDRLGTWLARMGGAE
jgi:phospholipase/carboxylesterase